MADAAEASRARNASSMCRPETSSDDSGPSRPGQDTLKPLREILRWWEGEELGGVEERTRLRQAMSWSMTTGRGAEAERDPPVTRTAPSESMRTSSR